MRPKIINTVLVYLIGAVLVIGFLLYVFNYAGGSFDNHDDAFILGATSTVAFFFYTLVFLLAIDKLEIF